MINRVYFNLNRIKVWNDAIREQFLSYFAKPSWEGPPYHIQENCTINNGDEIDY